MLRFAIRADPSVRLVALLTRSRPSCSFSKRSTSRRAPVDRPDSPFPRSPPDMPDFSNDDPFGALFGQVPEHGARPMRSSGEGFGADDSGPPAGPGTVRRTPAGS